MSHFVQRFEAELKKLREELSEVVGKKQEDEAQIKEFNVCVWEVLVVNSIDAEVLHLTYLLKTSLKIHPCFLNINCCFIELDCAMRFTCAHEYSALGHSQRSN